MYRSTAVNPTTSCTMSTTLGQLNDKDCDFEVFRSLIEDKVLARVDAILTKVVDLEARSRLIDGDSNRTIGLPEVLRILCISRSTLYDRINPKSKGFDPDFPRPFKMGNSIHSRSVWRQVDITSYLMSRAQSSARFGG